MTKPLSALATTPGLIATRCPCGAGACAPFALRLALVPRGTRYAEHWCPATGLWALVLRWRGRRVVEVRA